MPRIVQVTIGEPKVLIDVSSILCKCVSVSIHPYTYVCIPPKYYIIGYFLVCIHIYIFNEVKSISV